MPPNVRSYVGVDIAEVQLDYCCTENEIGLCGNTSQGRAELISKIKALPNPRVICEASGGYEKIVVAELLEAGIEVCVVSPGRVRAFAYAEGLLAKTDRIDAQLLRRFGQSVAVRLTQPSDPRLTGLRELLDHRRQLTTDLTQVEARLRLAGPGLKKLLQQQRTFLHHQVQKVNQLIEAQIESDPDLRTKSKRLQQLKGIGPILSATLLAYIPELGRINKAQLASLIGVAPHPKDSAKTRHPRHVRGGRAAVRHVLYMAAVSAARSNPVFAAFYQRLMANGKPAKVCLVAVMRKLLCVANHLIENPKFVLAQ